MDPRLYEEVSALFDQIADLPLKEQRRALDAASNATVRSEVERWLAADAAGASPLDRGVPHLSEIVEPVDKDLDIPRLDVAPYQIIRSLGRGGMGVVYLANRADGTFDRSVALKLVHGGFDSVDVMRRFHRERRILGALEHPNIARLYDAGVASDGRPFLVMEYVDGERIDRYADRLKLGIRRRVELFLDVCRAVSHAHQALVIHRDLKPSNIMIGRDGSVKLLDFGIAKLAGDEQDDAPTRTGLQPMTPQYAAPEQLRGEVLTAAADGYALGVVLYELLTGRRPSADGPSAVARAHSESAPRALPLASDAVTEESVASYSSRGQAVKTLRGDLDRILQRALNFEPHLRYQSVEAFTDDLRRYLAGLPIAARPPALAYRVSKFARRNRLAVGLTSLAVASLSVGSGMAAWQAKKARAERDVAVGVSRFLEELFIAPDPRRGQVGDTTPIIDVLARASEQLRTGLDSFPATRAHLLLTVGTVYRNMGRHTDALGLLRDAVTANHLVHGDLHDDTIDSRQLFGLTLGETGSRGEGIATLDSALTHERSRATGTHREARLLETLGRIHLDGRDLDQAEPFLRRSLEIRRSTVPVDSQQLATSANTLGALELQRGNYTAAIRLMEEALSAMLSDTSGDAGARRHDESGIRHNISFAYMQMGNVDEAERELRRALQVTEQYFPHDFPSLGRGRVRLADLLVAQWRSAPDSALIRRADSLYVSGLAVLTSLPHMRSEVFFYQQSYARALSSWGRGSEAERIMRLAVSSAEQTMGSKHPLVWSLRSELGWVIAERGRYAEAIPLLRASRDAVLETFPAGHLARLSADSHLGRALNQTGRYEEARTVLEPARAAALTALPEGHEARSRLTRLLTETYLGLGDSTRAAMLR